MAIDHDHTLSELISKLDKNSVPAHVGIIMDGNGRWAKAQGMPRSFGHRAGVERLRNLIELCDEVGVKALSVYAFSSENWKRPEWEINALMSLLTEFMAKEIAELNEKRVKITFMGETQALPDAARKAVDQARDLTKNNGGLIFNIALNYGGKAELVRAFKAIAQSIQEGKLSLDQIDERAIEQNLYSADMPELDLLIRTGGEQRVSNFMLWQLAYSEFIFTDVYWPDFDDVALANSLIEYQGRNRRYGGL